jgi:hypothetical protein
MRKQAPDKKTVARKRELEQLATMLRFSKDTLQSVSRTLQAMARSGA